MNCSLPSLAADWARIFSAAVRSRSSRRRSAVTSMTPARSSSTTTPSVGSDAVAVNSSPGAVSAVSDRTDCSCACSVEASMPAMRAGTFCRSASPCSVRKRRTSVTSRCTAAICASASLSSQAASGAGHSATTADSRPVSVVHSVSVTKGITGCRSRSSASSTWPRTARVTSACAPPPPSGTFASSRYQSHSSSHAKW